MRKSGDQQYDAENVMVTAYSQSLRRVADTYLRQGNYAGSVGSLMREFEIKYPRIPSVTDSIRYQVLFWALYYNQLLGVLPPSEFPDVFEKMKGQLTDQQLQRIEEFENPDIEGIEIRSMVVRPKEGHIAPDSTTTIIFTLPARLPEGTTEFGSWKIQTYPLSDPFSDPNFRFIHRQAIVFNGMPVAILSPALWQTEGATLVEISTKQPFHPDLEVDENGIPNTESSDDFNQLLGEEYDVYLAKAMELLSNVSGSDWPDRKSLISTLKSADSYFVAFHSVDGQLTYHMFKPLVKLSAFLAAKKRFLDRFQKAKQQGHNSDKLKKLLFSDAPMDAAGLQRYSKAVFRELILKPSERGEWWKTVWVEGSKFKSVRDEPDVGRDIYNVVSEWFRVKGLTLDSQVRAAGGSIDMLAMGASGRDIHRCGIELKYAHHNDVLNGISRQLPDYMEDLQAEVGIFLTLWCKGENFAKPAKYDKMSDLVSELRKSTPIDKNIDVMAVNASYRPPPSKRR